MSTIFKSRQVNTDPRPYRNEDSAERLTAQEAEQDRETGWEVTRDPRPEFNVTRDPEPWREPGRHGGRYAEKFGNDDIFDPRPEFDHPVNRILAGVRDDMAGSTDLNGDAKATAEYWLSFSDDWDKDGLTATPDEIDHARRVLTRLAGWSA